MIKGLPGHVKNVYFSISKGPVCTSQRAQLAASTVGGKEADRGRGGSPHSQSPSDGCSGPKDRRFLGISSPLPTADAYSSSPDEFHACHSSIEGIEAGDLWVRTASAT